MDWRTTIGILFGMIGLAGGATAFPSQAFAQETRRAPALIPQAYLGAWAHRPEDCSRTGEGKPVRIRDDRIVFYKSVATVRTADLPGPREIVIHADISGEGDYWKANIRLSLSHDGCVLTLNGTDNRVRCPLSPVS